MLRAGRISDAVSIDRIGFAALTGGEHPSPGGQFRRRVQDGLAVGEQPLRDMPADAVAALDRPVPLAVPLPPFLLRPDVGGRAALL
jgi:hypothetical protein